jgi:uncharacterized repeat protein (TIGR04076 family)
MPKKIIAKVLSLEKWCFAGYKVGDEFDISKMKGRGYCVKEMSTYVKMLKSGDPLPWETDPSKARVTCSSEYGTVVFELRLSAE